MRESIVKLVKEQEELIPKIEELEANYDLIKDSELYNSEQKDKIKYQLVAMMLYCLILQARIEVCRKDIGTVS